MAVPLPNQEATNGLGAALAPLLRAGDTVLLHGPMGAGKSTLVRALLRKAAGDPALDVPSPSFTLVQTYTLPHLTLHHMDLWRLDGPGGVEELGWHELLHDVVLVEWPDRLGTLTPKDALHIALAYATDGQTRKATLSGWDARLNTLVASLGREG
jgi:tRNA threonylcarbamoyladenosine biosynthesis protein TsaE